ncbi:MAG: hypothetical protein ABSH51_03790 [Solirubrobacteraceae bacterium]
MVTEIDLALRSRPGPTVIPVLVDDTQPPDGALLPPSIRALPGRNVVRLHHANLLDEIERLMAFLLLGSGEAALMSAHGSVPVIEEQRRLVRTGTALAVPATGDDPVDDAQPLPEAPVAAAPGPNHYRTVADKAGRLVVFLGADANADELDGTWQEDAGVPPDDRDLALYLAANAGLQTPSADLAEVAQYALAMHGESDLIEWLDTILKLRDGAKPAPRSTTEPWSGRSGMQANSSTSRSTWRRVPSPPASSCTSPGTASRRS